MKRDKASGCWTQGGLINLSAPDQRSRLGSNPSTSTNPKKKGNEVYRVPINVCGSSNKNIRLTP